MFELGKEEIHECGCRTWRDMKGQKHCLTGPAFVSCDEHRGLGPINLYFIRDIWQSREEWEYAIRDAIEEAKEEIRTNLAKCYIHAGIVQKEDLADLTCELECQFNNVFNESFLEHDEALNQWLRRRMGW